MSIYDPLPAGQHLAQRYLSDRRFLLSLSERYDVLNVVFTMLILLVTVIPLVPRYPLFLIWPVAYLAYAAPRFSYKYQGNVFRLLEHVQVHLPRRPAILRVSLDEHVLPILFPMPSGSRSPTEHLSESDVWRAGRRAQTVLVIMGTLAFIVSVRHFDANLHLLGGADGPTWLLLVRPVHATARQDNFKWTAGICLLAVLANAVGFWLAPLGLRTSQTRGVLPDSLWLVILTETLWLIFLSLLPALLFEKERTLSAASKVLAEFARIRALSISDFANQAAGAIARQFGLTHVNILLCTSQGEQGGEEYTFIGASSLPGLTLVKRKEPIRLEHGIVSWAVRHRSFRVANDLVRYPDPEYSPHPAFLGIQAEAAFSLPMPGYADGVLDIQCTFAHAFSGVLVNQLQNISLYLANALSSLQAAEQAAGLYDVADVVAARMSSPHQLHHVLRHIVEVTRDKLGADLVTLYPWHPESHTVGNPVVAGYLHTYVASGDDVTHDQDAAFWRVMETEEPLFLSPLIDHPVPINERNGEMIAAAFAQREAIRTMIALPLRTGADGVGETLGALFVNYRQHHDLNATLREYCRALAQQAALAISGARLYERAVQNERNNLWMELHDAMSQDVSGTRMALERLVANLQREREGTMAPQERRLLEHALTGSRSMQRQLHYLGATLQNVDRGDATSRRLCDELEEYVAIIRTAFEVECSLNWDGDRDRPLISAEVGHAVYMITREAVHNALRHGHAIRIAIGVTVSADPPQLTLRVTNDGASLSGHQKVGTLHKGGLRHMQLRAKAVGGTANIGPSVDEDGREGVAVVATFPLPLRSPDQTQASGQSPGRQGSKR